MFIRAFEGVQRPDQPPGSVGEDRTAQPGVNILISGVDAQFNVTQAAQSKILHWHIAVIYPAKFPHAGIGSQFIGMGFDKVFQVQAADFLFAFDDELNIAGKFALFGKNCIDSEQAADQMTLVIAHPASKQHTVPASGFERR